MLVGVISYIFSDERVLNASQIHWLMISLVDSELYPAQELAVLFCQRWYVELVFDEVKTHLRLSACTLHSLTPQGVAQEVYGLLLVCMDLHEGMFLSARILCNNIRVNTMSPQR